MTRGESPVSRVAPEPEFFVPVALSDIEAVAVESACGVVVTSAPGHLGPGHPLFSGMLKISDAYKAAKAKAEGVSP